MTAQDISTSAVGDEGKTVISFGMGLYLPAKKLQMARKDLNRLILRSGELHIVMAMLKTIGAYIESGGIDLCWQEAELYGSCTVKQIPDGKHVKRGEKANLTTLQAFFRLYLKGFLKNEPHLHTYDRVLSSYQGSSVTSAEKVSRRESRELFKDSLMLLIHLKSS